MITIILYSIPNNWEDENVAGEGHQISAVLRDVSRDMENMKDSLIMARVDVLCSSPPPPSTTLLLY